MSLQESLLQLNQVDAQVRGLRSRLESAKRYLDAQSRQLQVVDDTQQELKTRLQHVKATIANHESEMATIDERIEKLRDELNSSETNKQYTAVLTELNTVKANRSEIEDATITEMESVDSIEAELAEVETQREERVKVRDHAEKQLREREAEIGTRLSELETEREHAAAAVPPEALAIFDDLCHIYDGEPMASVEEVNRRRREYACAACNILLPFELVSLLMGDIDSVVRCAACSRILYLQDELRGALAKH